MTKPITSLLSAALFYAVLTPLAVVRRALGADPLALRRAAPGASYWRRRARPQPTAASLRRQD